MSDKLNKLIQRARDNAATIDPAVLAKLNRHLQQTGQLEIPLPWVDQTRQPFPPSPWQDQEAESTPPDGTELYRLKEDYKIEMARFAANPEEFTLDQHSRMYRQRALISMTTAAQKL